MWKLTIFLFSIMHLVLCLTKLRNSCRQREVLDLQHILLIIANWNSNILKAPTAHGYIFCKCTVFSLILVNFWMTQSWNDYSMQYNEQFKKKEPLEYDYDVCEAILLWEQVKSLVSEQFMNHSFQNSLLLCVYCSIVM